MSTKEKILEMSLRLFSEKGYNGTSAKADRQPQCMDEVLVSIEKHLNHFYDTYGKS